MIEFNNLTEVEIDKNLVKRIVDDVLQGEGIKGSPEISVAFLGPGRMRKLNKQYRRKNRATDVLSFPEKEVPFEKFKIGQIKKHQGLGEIVICLREVKKNARRNNTGFENELKRVLIHGVLHLLGYEHEKGKAEEERMREKEEEYFGKSKIQITNVKSNPKSK